jgi:tRNA G26 N,N-dimethylase Trm1
LKVRKITQKVLSKLNRGELKLIHKIHRTRREYRKELAKRNPLVSKLKKLSRNYKSQTDALAKLGDQFEKYGIHSGFIPQ